MKKKFKRIEALALSLVFIFCGLFADTSFQMEAYAEINIVQKDLMAYDGFEGEPGLIKGQNTGFGFRNTFDYEGGDYTSNAVVIGSEKPFKYDNLLSTAKYFTYKSPSYRCGRGFNTNSDGPFAKAGYVQNGQIAKKGKTLYMSVLMRTDGQSKSAIEFHSSSGFWHGNSRKFAIGTFTAEDGATGSTGADGKKYWSLRVADEAASKVPNAILSNKEVSASEDVLVVLKIDFNDTSRVSMYLNPDITKPLPNTPDITTTTTVDMGFSGMTVSSGKSYSMDELRLGQTYDSVVPLSNNKMPVTGVKVVAADGDVNNIRGARIVGSNESATNGFKNIATIPNDITNPEFELNNIDNSTGYRYVKVYGVTGSYCKIAELEFYNGERKLVGDPFGSVAQLGHEAQYAFDGLSTTYYAGEQADDQYVGLDLGGETSVAKPKANYEEGTYDSPISIELSTETSGAEIYYTLDGKTPTKKNGILYSEPIELVQGQSILIKAVGVKDGLFDSQMFAAGYGIGVIAPVATGLKTYVLGNSLTDTIIHQLPTVAQNAGYAHDLIRWTIPGAAMMWLMSHQGDGFGETWVVPNSCTTNNEKTAKYSEQYNDTSWFDPSEAKYTVDTLSPIDVITVQPFNNGDNEANSIASCKKIYNKALESNPDIRFLVYGSWGPLDTLGDGGEFERVNKSYDSLNKFIAKEMNKLYPDKQTINIVPNTNALRELRDDIAGGIFPGTDDFVGFASAEGEDNLHLSPAGQYLIAMTTFVTMYKVSPVGRVDYKPDSITDEQAEALKRIAWKVNIENEDSGVTGKEENPGVIPTRGPTKVPTSTPVATATPIPTATPTPPVDGFDGFVWCANEGDVCTFDEPTDVAYGANGKYNYKYNVTGKITFDNATFGDPITGTVKYGYFRPVAKATATPGAEATSTPVAGATSTPTVKPTTEPTTAPTATPTSSATATPTVAPTTEPTLAPTPTVEPTPILITVKNPSAPKISVVKVKVKKKYSKTMLKIAWKANKSQYYTVQMSKKKLSGFKKVKKYKKGMSSYTKKGLKAKNKYYFRVRTYKLVAGKKYYSKYSAVKGMKL